MEDIADLGVITRGLVERGHDREAVLGILGGNWMRVFQTVVG